MSEIYAEARLIGATKPLVEETGSDLKEFIAYCARVSNPANQANHETSDRLIAYLIKHKHWSPFEMASAAIEIKTTRDIGRQILRHRSFSFQEFSQRYAEVNSDFVFREPRLQDQKNRQNSIELSESTLMDKENFERVWEYEQREVMKAATRAYEWALKNGIAKEQARAVLPEGLTKTTMYMAGTIRSWIHFIELRSGPETQKEHRMVAIACAYALAGVFEL